MRRTSDLRGQPQIILKGNKMYDIDSGDYGNAETSKTITDIYRSIFFRAL